MKTNSSVKLTPIDTPVPSPEPGASKGARRATAEAPGSGGTQPPAIAPPDPEVAEKKPRRRFTAKYKLRILNEDSQYKKYILYTVSIIGILMSAFSLVIYVSGDYYNFISYKKNIITFFPSALRFSCRLGYVVAFIGLLMLKRWGFYLCLTVWLAQLVPSAIHSIVTGASLSGHAASAMQLAIYLAVTLPFFKLLENKSTFTSIFIFFAGALALHAAIYFSIYYGVVSI